MGKRGEWAFRSGCWGRGKPTHAAGGIKTGAGGYAQGALIGVSVRVDRDRNGHERVRVWFTGGYEHPHEALQLIRIDSDGERFFIHCTMGGSEHD